MLLPLVAVLLVLSGCSYFATPSAAPQASGPIAPPTTSVPTPEPRLPDVLLTNLPTTGRSQYVGQGRKLQCVDLHWRHRASLPVGVTVRIAGVNYDRQVFRVSTTGCGQRGPTCLNFTFGDPLAPDHCSLALRTRRPVTATTDDRRIGFSGWVSCPQLLGTAGCQRVLVKSLDARHTVKLHTPL